MKDRKNIISEYDRTGSIRATARSLGLNRKTVGRYVQEYLEERGKSDAEYTAYLKERNYSINSIGKCIKELKTILRAAESEGYEVNPKYKDKKFKGTRIEVDSIYLNRGDLEKIMNLDISKCSQGYALARDIFMVGVWTAQRVSDYNNLSRENIKQHRIPKVIDNKLTYKEFQTVEIRQKKTGAKVSVSGDTEKWNVERTGSGIL